MGDGMERQGNAAPVIIRRKKSAAGDDGHHGGAWKVAYADFVTAMMAFFLLMWLLNATTESQRKGLADYFSPTIPVNRISGGGDGAFGGNNAFSEDVVAQSGRGGSASAPDEERQARGATGLADESEALDAAADEAPPPDLLARVEDALFSRGGESMVSELALRHIVTRLTDEGLIVELFDLPEQPLFAADTDRPTEVLDLLTGLLAEVFALVDSPIAVAGHTRSYPVVLADNPVWDLSAARAQRMRQLLEAAGLPAARVQRITGHADRRPSTPDPAAVRNNRLEVILLRGRI